MSCLGGGGGEASPAPPSSDETLVECPGGHFSGGPYETSFISLADLCPCSSPLHNSTKRENRSVSNSVFEL